VAVGGAGAVVEPARGRPRGGVRRGDLELPHADVPVRRRQGRVRGRELPRRGRRRDDQDAGRRGLGQQGDAVAGDRIRRRQAAERGRAGAAASRRARGLFHRELGEDRDRGRVAAGYCCLVATRYASTPIAAISTAISTNTSVFDFGGAAVFAVL